MGASYLTAMRTTEELEGIADELRIFITARELCEESDVERIRELEGNYRGVLARLAQTKKALHDLMERAWEIETVPQGE